MTGTLFIKVATSQLFRILQRPLPVIISFLPTRGFFLIRVTEAPRRAAVPAAIMPAAPAPMTAIFLLIILILLYVVFVIGVNSLSVPDLLQRVEGLGNLILLLKNGCDNKRIDKAERSDKRINY